MQRKGDPKPALTPEATRLGALLRAHRWAAPVAAPIVFGMWWVWRTPALLTMAAIVVVTAGAQWFAARATARNDVERGIIALTAAIWLPALGMAVLAPDVWAITAVLCILAVLLAVRFASPRLVLQMIGVSTLILLVGSWFLVRPWTTGFPPDTSPVALGAIIALGSGIPAMIGMFSVWQSNARLVDTVEELRESERNLEDKVATRTADLVESQRHLARARDDALAANQHKSAFLAHMSHELRTPLNAVIGFSEMLAEKVFGDLNEKQEEYVGDIHQSGKHLLSLINDVLDLSKIEAGRLELSLMEFPLEETIDNALVLTRERAFAHGLRQVRAIEGELGTIEADERKVKQILVNLLSNAVKFTDAGGTVTVRARRIEEAIEISVEDTGVGIAADEQKLVFDEFRQAGTDHDRRSEGTGLGLTLVKRLAALHGGSVRLTSELGSGSCFTVILPARVPDDLRPDTAAPALDGANA